MEFESDLLIPAVQHMISNADMSQVRLVWLHVGREKKSGSPHCSSHAPSSLTTRVARLGVRARDPDARSSAGVLPHLLRRRRGVDADAAQGARR